MGASSSGLLDEAKISHIKGKIKSRLLFLCFSAFFSFICSFAYCLFRTVHEDIISQPYLNMSFPQRVRWIHREEERERGCSIIVDISCVVVDKIAVSL